MVGKGIIALLLKTIFKNKKKAKINRKVGKWHKLTIFNVIVIVNIWSLNLLPDTLLSLSLECFHLQMRKLRLRKVR